jgi:nucleoside-diphosphate-sugar epimerase
MLITGANGFVGAHLVQRLVELGADVVAVVRPEADLARIVQLLDRIELVRVDVTELEADHVAGLAGRAATVLHLASAGVVAHDTDPRVVVATATDGTLRVLEAAHAVGAARFVYCGSCFEYGAGNGVREDATPAPLTEYGAAKAAGWLLAQAFWRRRNLPVVGGGPGDLDGAREGPPRRVG